jgi:phage-related protein/tetratricopeptide (TPR) repeat protein
MGREVADAYIEVHGDLSKFREDLGKADVAGRAYGENFADSMTEGFGERAFKGLTTEWNSLLDALYSGEKVDWDRALGTFDFDSEDFEAVHEKMADLLEDMRIAGKVTEDQYKVASKQIDRAIKKQRQLFYVERDLAEERERNAENLNNINNQYLFDLGRMEEAQNRFNRSFEEMFASNRLKALERDFRAIADSMAAMDWAGFVKGFDSLEEARERIGEVTGEMLNLGRISEDNAKRIARHVDEWIEAEELRRIQVELTADAIKAAEEEERAEKQRTADTLKRLRAEESRLDSEAKARALTAARLLREEQERYNQSLEGMIRAGHLAALERDFRMLTEAIRTNDWSHVSRGSRTLREMNDKVMAVVDAMQDMGRLGADGFKFITQQLSNANNFMDTFNVQLEGASKVSKTVGSHWSVISDFAGMAAMTVGKFHKGAAIAAGVLEVIGKVVEFVGPIIETMVDKVKAMAGFNVLGDIFQQGSEFLTNLDRNALKIGKMTTLLGSFSAVIGGVIGMIFTMAQDLAAIAGGLLTAAPAFIFGTGIGIGVLTAALQDMDEVLKDLKPKFERLQDVISASFWAKAAGPIRDLVNSLMPLLEPNLKVTAGVLGTVFAAFADALKAIPHEAIGRMFDRMNRAIEILARAMGPIIRAFTILGDVGSKYFERFAEWIVKLAEKFEAFITNASNNGDLERWIDKAIEGMDHLWSILDSIWSIFNSIADAARKGGASGLEGFATALDKIAKLLAGDRFQKALGQVFEGFFLALEGIGRGFEKLGPSIEAALPTFVRVMDTIGKIVEKILGMFGKVIENPAVQQGFEKLMDGMLIALEKLEPVIGPLADSFGKLLEIMAPIMPQVAELFKLIVEKLGPSFDLMMQKLAPLIPPLLDMVTRLIEIIAPHFDTFVKDVLPLMVTSMILLMPHIIKLVELLTPALAETIKKVAEFMMGFAIALQFLNIYAGPAMTVLGRIYAFFTDPIERAKMIAGAASLAKDIVDGFINGLKENPTIKNAWTIFTVIIDVVKKHFGIQSPSTVMFDIGKNVVQGFFDGMTNIGTTLGTIWEGFKTTITTKANEIKTGITTWAGEVKTNWDNFWGGAGTNLKNTWEGFTGTVGTKANEIKNGITTWAGDVGNGWNGFWGDVGTNLNNAWEGFTGTVSEKAGEIKTNVSSFGTDVKNNWDGFWGDVGGSLSENWRQFSGTVEDKSGAMSGDVASMGTDMKGKTQDAMHHMWRYLSGSFTDFVNMVMQRSGDIVGWVGTLPGRIGSALSGLGGMLRGAGQSIMQGFLNGLMSMWGSITSFVGNIADWIRDNKGPLDYDRTLLEPAGQAIMVGLQRGLESRMDPLLNTLQAITDVVTSTVTADLSQSKMYVTGKDAAQGLADGLKANRSAVHSALGTLGAFTVPAGEVSVGGSFGAMSGAATTVGGKSLTIAEGAISITTPTKDPELVAAKVIDSFANFSNF